MPSLPAQMTAIAIRAPGAADMLVPEQRPLPRPADGEVLVKVAAAGVNRPDVMQRLDIPGLEIAGEVVALGAGVKRWKLGDKVMGLVVGGGYAEYFRRTKAMRCRYRRASRSSRPPRSPKPSSPSGTTPSSAGG